MDELTNYYTYLYLDPRKPGNYVYDNLDCCFLYEPFYVGKGKGVRIDVHVRPSSLRYKSLKNNKLKSIIAAGYAPYRIKYVDNVTQNEALLNEMNLVESIGRVEFSDGPLTNMTNGGDNVAELIAVHKRKKVDKLCLKTSKVLATYDSGTIAGIENSVEIGNISACCLGKVKTAGGYGWRFHEVHERRVSKKNKEVVMLDDIYTQILTFKNSNEAAVHMSISCNAIDNCCKGVSGMANGYIWEYGGIDEKLRLEYRIKRQTINSRTEKPIKRICKSSGEEMTYKSINHAAEAIGVTPSMINLLAKGKRGRLCKYKFYYVNDRSYDDAIEKEHNSQCQHPLRKPVQQLSQQDVLIKEWESATQAATILGINLSRICMVARQGWGTVGGFKWIYG